MRGPRLGLGARLALAMVGSLIVLLTILGLFYVHNFRQNQEILVNQSEDRLGDLIRRSTRLAMLRNDRDELSAMLPEIGRLPQLLRVRIYDKSGTIRYSSMESEIGSQVNMSADACDRCHATAEPLKKLDRPDRTRIYRAGGQRVMGMIHPIPNEPDCVGAPCHVHPADRAVLGVLDVQMSLQAVDRTVSRGIRSFLISSILTLVIVSALSVLWAWRTVRRPVRLLVQATQAVSAGDLDQRVPDSFDNDLSHLVHSFNQMTVDLRTARQESEGWARTLENRVEEKSKALSRAQDEMVQVEKMASLGKLAAIVAHEINNPLAGIRTYAKVLLRKLSGGPVAAERTPPGGTWDEWRDSLARIEAEAARCGEIVRNLLSFSRNSRPHVEPTDINTQVTESLRLIQHQMDLSGIQVQRELGTGLSPVECDPQQIKQVFLAVFMNACEAMPSGGQLSVATRTAPRPSSSVDGGSWAGEGAGVEIVIRDSGVGMDTEVLKHLFEPFFTTKDGSATGGTGLGLTVVYSILRSHGGAIGVNSAPGRGSEFSIFLPCRQARQPEGEESS